MKVGLLFTLETLDARRDKNMGELLGSGNARNLCSVNRPDQPKVV